MIRVKPCTTIQSGAKRNNEEILKNFLGVKNMSLEQKKTVKVVIYGEHGVGKTSLLDTLPADSTLVINLEAGLSCVPHWLDRDCIITARDWPTVRAATACVTPADPKAVTPKPYCDVYCRQALTRTTTDKGTPIDVTKYTDLFIDSITVGSKYAKKWAMTQPESFTKAGEPNKLGAFGLLADELVGWFDQLQFANLNVWILGTIDLVTLDNGTNAWVPAIDGSKAGKRLYGIVDDVVTLAEFPIKDSTEKRRLFVCNKYNPWGYPAKTRNGLGMIEPAHLGLISEKIKNAPKERTLKFDTTPVELDQIIY